MTLVVVEVAAGEAFAIVSTVRQSVAGSVEAGDVEEVPMNVVAVEDVAAAGGFPTQREGVSIRIVT